MKAHKMPNQMHPNKMINDKVKLTNNKHKMSEILYKTMCSTN